MNNNQDYNNQYNNYNNGQYNNNQYSYNNDQYNNYNNQYSPVPQVEQKKTMAIWSLVMGILSVTICCGGFLPAILAIVFANISKKNNEDGAGMAKAGMIMGIVGIVLGVLAIIFYIIYVVAIAGIAGVSSMGSGLYY